MKRILFSIAIITALIMSIAVQAQQVARHKPEIITTTTDIAAITRAVVGDGAKVESLMKDEADPDFVIPDPKVVFRSKHADCLFRIGADLEDRWIKSFYTQTENQQLKQGASANITLASEVTLLPVSSADGTTEPIIHKYGNPYFWLDPANGTRLATYICNYLTVMFPEWKEDYNANLKKFIKDVEVKMSSWKKAMAPYKNVKFIAYAHYFDYFANRFNLDIVDYIQPAAGVPASDARIEEIIKKMKDEKIKYLIVSTNVSPQNYQAILEATGATLIQLPISVGVDWIETYIQLFDYITGIFKRNLIIEDQAEQNQ